MTKGQIGVIAVWVILAGGLVAIPSWYSSQYGIWSTLQNLAIIEAGLAVLMGVLFFLTSVRAETWRRFWHKVAGPRVPR